MLANFKKLGVAAAVAAALGASGAAHAITQGEPGDALLVPYAFTTGAGKINTMIGIISASPDFVNVNQFPTLTASAKTGTGGGTVHWYFFDKDSSEVVNGTFKVTGEDFTPFDFGRIVQEQLPSALNKPGYLVFADGAADQNTASSLILYAAAYQIRGNWATQTFIPVLPLIDDVDGTAGDEVTHTGSFVTNVNPVTAGMLLPSATTISNRSWFSLRYYLGDDPKGATEFVLWFPDNSSDRESQPIVVYDGDENSFSAKTSIPYELNFLEVKLGAAGNAPHTGAVADGLADTGFVLFSVADFSSASSAVTPGEGSRAGVAFSLVAVDGSASVQVQTELAQERGLK